MSNLVVPIGHIRRPLARLGPWLAFSCSTLVWAACGETEQNSKAEPAVSSAAGGSDTASTTSDSAGMNSGGTANPNSATHATSSSTVTTGAIEPSSGGATATSGTDQGAAGADPGGSGGTGGNVEPDDECELEMTFIRDDECKLTTSCPEFVQHTTCYMYNSVYWQCDTDEHDRSKPETLTGNPMWFDSVTGTTDAAEACNAVAAVNLKRPSATLIDIDDCSNLTAELTPTLMHLRLCGPRYQSSSDAMVWPGLPASATCREAEDGLKHRCDCSRTGADDGEYLIDANDTDAALVMVWDFCTNTSPSVPVELGECESIANNAVADGPCEFVNNCPLVVTDASGLELEELVYQEVTCGLDGNGPLSCTCRVGDDDSLSFAAEAEQGMTVCESLAVACDPRNTVERAGGPAVCEPVSEIIGRERSSHSYSCSIPITLGGKSGTAKDYGTLECAESPGGWLSCTCRDSFTDTTTTIEPSTADLDLAWDLAVSLCEGNLEAAPEP